MQGLTVGNTVQYVTETATYAAIITKVLDTESGRVNLTVFIDNENNANVIVARANSRVFSELETPGTWHWLPAVD